MDFVIDNRNRVFYKKVFGLSFFDHKFEITSIDFSRLNEKPFKSLVRKTEKILIIYH